MAKDIVPELLEEIEQDFLARVAKSAKVKAIQDLAESGAGTYKDALDYATEIGDILQDVLGLHIKGSVLPDGKMYYNIAERIMNSVLKRDHNLVANLTAQIQTTLNEASGLGLQAIKPAFNQSRIDGIIERLVSGELFDEVAWLLEAPITNFSQAVVDESVRVNADFHASAGLSPTITRSVLGKCCDWCDNLQGTYPYKDVKATGHAVFMRHRNCDCLVEYNPGDGRRQDAHTKKWR